MNSDWELLSNARNGDEIACKLIFKKYYKNLVRLTSLITGSIDSAKDIAQETFVRILNNSIKYNKGNFNAFITTIAFRLALKEKARYKRDLTIEKDIYIDKNPIPLEIQIAEEHQKFLFQLISSLPEGPKEILVLRYYSGISYETISEILKIPIGTVKSRIYYAVKTCRDKLKERGIIE
jgi:RNA polymerase sigma-70 factor (ECF subfamily)